jgi:biopolymer transport protein ExbD
MSQPPAQMQITPLIDVLLVLLVMGVLAWSASQASGHARVKASASSDALLGLTLPLRSGVDAASTLTPTEDRLWIGLGLQGRLSWGEAPVTRDILTRQLREALKHNRHAEVWLAVDQALPYADLLPWLEWLQAQQVTRLTLLHRAQPPASVTGKP